jgi:hypothetical protein
MLNLNFKQDVYEVNTFIFSVRNYIYHNLTCGLYKSFCSIIPGLVESTVQGEIVYPLKGSLFF